MPERWLRAGIIGRPHGLDGSFHVRDAVPALLELDREVLVAGVPRRIARRAGSAERPILRLHGDTGRAAAEALRGEEILAARDAAPELEDEEWWAEDLEGCRVVDGQLRVGVVVALVALPSCEVLEVVREPAGSTLLVPLVRDAVRAVDVERRVIDVDLRFLGEEP